MIQKGDKSEMAVANAFTQFGTAVSKPLSDNLPYDFIVDYNGLHRVQVKTARERSDNKNSIIADLTRSRHNYSTGHSKEYYSDDEIDFFAIYWPKRGEVYLFDFDEVGKNAVTICVGDVYNPNQQRVGEDYLLEVRLDSLTQS